jgi:hypothetical protein
LLQVAGPHPVDDAGAVRTARAWPAPSCAVQLVDLEAQRMPALAAPFLKRCVDVQADDADVDVVVYGVRVAPSDPRRPRADTRCRASVTDLIRSAPRGPASRSSRAAPTWAGAALRRL